ncbi:MAG: 2-oxo acid dehydrogenase subunit E2, partial [Candidatus Dadabacteria bacterium]
DKGKILSWAKKEGDKVERGDVLAEVETDKANLEIESFHQGYLLKILAPEGTEAMVGDVIAYIGEKGEKVPEAEKTTGAKEEKKADKPQLETKEEEKGVKQVKEEAASKAEPSLTESGRVKASPLAKKIAKEHNLELSLIQGSGPGGRIVKKDVEEFLLSQAQVKKEPVFVQPAVEEPFEESLEDLSKMRQAIAARMQESVREIPHFYLFEEIVMDSVVALREALKQREDYKGISYNHFVIKAASLAIAEEKRINCAVKDGKLYTPPSINIGIVTALPDGLLIPVLHNVEKLTLKDIVFEAQALIERARAGRPSSKDLTGATFSISNLGMFGIDSFTAIISPGQGAILAVGGIKKKAVVRNESVVPASVMSVALSVDHRIIDGLMGAKFLSALKKYLEQPALLFA